MPPLDCSDRTVFEQENARVGGNWEGYFASHPDLRGIPGLVFPGSPGQPVSHGGWDAFGLLFDGVTVPSHENKLKVANNARNWFQVLGHWIRRFPPNIPLDQDFLTAFGNDYARRYNKDPQTCCSEDLFVVIVSFIEARKEAIGRLVDSTGFERLHDFIDSCIRDTKDRRWVLPLHIYQIIINDLQPQAQRQALSPQNTLKREASSTPEESEKPPASRPRLGDPLTQDPPRRPNARMEELTAATIERLGAKVALLTARLGTRETLNEIELKSCRAALEKSQETNKVLWEELRGYLNKGQDGTGMTRFQWGPDDYQLYLQSFKHPTNHEEGA